jgi:putative oxidoreductase
MPERYPVTKGWLITYFRARSNERRGTISEGLLPLRQSWGCVTLMSETRSGWTPVILRLALGGIVLVHGLGKLLSVGPAAVEGGVDGFAGYLMSLGVAFPEVAAWAVTIVETVGAVLILLGILTRYVAALVVIDMAGAIWFAHLPQGLVASGGELPIALGLVGIAVILSGPGRLSVERAALGHELVPASSE